MTAQELATTLEVYARYRDDNKGSALKAAAMLRQQAEQIESLKADAERYRWLFRCDKVYSQFRKAYDAWDGCDGKIGFDAAIDEMKGSS